MSVAVAWSVKYLSSNPRARFRFPAGSDILISILGLGVSFVCALSCVVSGGGPDVVLTTHSGMPALEYLSSVLVHSLWPPYRHLTEENLGYKSRGM